MRVVFLLKRQYMRQDVIDDRYGRLYELPRQLARRGHEVLGICFSYRGKSEGRFDYGDAEPGSLVWHSLNLGRLVLPGLFRYRHRIIPLVKAFEPDVLVGCSDSFHVIMAAWLSHHLEIPYAVDLYDNFESFGMTRIPGVLPLYQRALKKSGGVSCVSETLSKYISEKYCPKCPITTIESTINSSVFYPGDRTNSRRNLQLPINAKLIGTMGALDKSRGIGALYQAYKHLARTDKDLHLVLAGSVDSRLPVPTDERIHYLGMLPHEQIPELLASLDVAVICIRDTVFGRYSFPQKAYEIMACQTPLVSAAIGSLKTLLARYPQCLYKPDHAIDLANKIQLQLTQACLPDIVIPTWSDQAQVLEKLLVQVINQNSHE